MVPDHIGVIPACRRGKRNPAAAASAEPRENHDGEYAVPVRIITLLQRTKTPNGETTTGTGGATYTGAA